jgi:uncharacterized protein YdaU (DUF1376 family)
MSHIEHSAFVYLSILLWENDGRLRDNDKWLSRNLRLSSKQWQEARDAVLQHFTAAGGFITAPDMIAEIDRRKGVVEKRRAAGQASAAARANQQTSNTCSAGVEQNGNDARLNSNLYQVGSDLEERLESDRSFRVIDGSGR